MREFNNTLQRNPFNILLIGDSCTDEYYYGICERLSPEAPVPVLKITNHESKPGMVLNVEKNLRAFDCQTTVITNKEIIQKIRYIDIKSNQHLLRVDNDVCIDALELEKLKDLEKYDAIVISDYNKGFIEENTIIKIKEKYSCPIFIDTKKTDLQKFEGCIVKINSLEYEKIKSECTDLIVTLGKNGARYKNKIYPSPVVEVYDVCGAGDTFLAALCFKFLNTKSLDDSIDFANKAAAISVQHRGVYSLTKEDILKL